MEHPREVILAEDTPGFGKAGDRVSLALTPTDVQDSSEIPTYLAGYRPFPYRAYEASPELLVGPSIGKYRTFNSDDAFMPSVVKGSLQGAISEVDPSSSLADYAVTERYIGSFIPVQTEAESTFDVRAVAGRKCRNKIDLDLEIDLWAMLGAAANWNASAVTAVAGGDEWDVSGNPIYDIQSAVEASYQQVTEVWMNQHMGHVFMRHPEVKNHMRQMMGDAAVTNAAANIYRASDSIVDFTIPGLPPIRIAGAKAKVGGASRPVSLLGNVVVLTCRQPGIPTSGEEIQTSLTIRRRGEAGVGWEAREYFVNGRGPKGGTMLVTSVADTLKFTSNVAGGLITNVHTA